MTVLFFGSTVPTASGTELAPPTAELPYGGLTDTGNADYEIKLDGIAPDRAQDIMTTRSQHPVAPSEFGSLHRTARPGRSEGLRIRLSGYLKTTM